MIKRIVAVSSPAHIRHELGSLCVDVRDGESGRVPIEDLGLLVLEDPGATISLPALARCAEAGAAVLVCDGKHMPVGLLLPLHGHSLQTKTLREQIQASEPTRKRIWQAIVRAKIRNQAAVLALAGGDPIPLGLLEDRVQSGDPDNVEARAARMYWPRLFGETFRRDRDASGVHALLNYGYAIIRAAVARAIVGAGLTPHLGLHHHNQYDAFCLADDLMEPLRPLVDARVHDMWSHDPAVTVSPATKRSLLAILTDTLDWRGEELPIFVCLTHYATATRTALVEGPAAFMVPGIEFLAPPAD